MLPERNEATILAVVHSAADRSEAGGDESTSGAPTITLAEAAMVSNGGTHGMQGENLADVCQRGVDGETECETELETGIYGGQSSSFQLTPPPVAADKLVQ